MSTDGPKFLASAELFLEQRRLTDASRFFHLAENAGCGPGRCAAGRWMAAMLAGEFEAAWREGDAIRRRGDPDPHRLWQGEEMRDRRVILRCLHGFGDAVQFLRYAPALRSLAASLMVECSNRAVEIVRCMPGIDQVIAWGPTAPDEPPQWDVQLEIMELPYIFRTTLDDLPIGVDYLSLPHAALYTAAQVVRPQTSERKLRRPRIGVCWSSGGWNPSRSIPLQLLAPTLRRSDCEFWNLQGGSSRHEWHNFQLGTQLRDSPVLADAGIVPLAAVIAQLDLVVTVDTLAAHLAGALKVPCFLLLQHAADWRWMVGRDDSPWYPSLRLFRQPSPGDWDSVVGLLHSAVNSFVGNIAGRLAA